MRNMRAPLVGVVLLSSAGALARRFEGRHAIGYGTNLGNTLEAPKEGDWQGHYATAEFFEDQKGAGFSTVRIPVRWDLHMGETAPYTINATFLARIQEVVGWCLAPGLNCIVNAHWDSWIDTNSSAVFQERLPRYTALWEQVGAAFAGASDSLWFESYNEPENLSTDDLNAMLAAFYSALRPLHPDRLLIYGWLRGMGASWIQENNHSNWNAMAFNESDPNLAVEVHSVSGGYGSGSGSGSGSDDRTAAAALHNDRTGVGRPSCGAASTGTFVQTPSSLRPLPLRVPHPAQPPLPTPLLRLRSIAPLHVCSTTRGSSAATRKAPGASLATS